MFMDRDEVEVHKLAKKERGQYTAILTEQTWSIKDLLYGFWGNFACGIQRVVPSGQDICHCFLYEIGLVSLQITIHDMNKDGTDIDKAILKGLLKGLLICMVSAYYFNFLPS